MTPWYESRYTGLVADLQPIPLRAHDPDVPIWAGRVERRPVGGAGWDDVSAKAACVGEAIERHRMRPLDPGIEASAGQWPLDEPAVDPEHWVLFHPDQYVPGFPFSPFDRATRCRWVACRQALTGDPWWVPEEFVYLEARTRHRFCPGFSTGLSCGRADDPVLLRGLQEVVERDAVVGAWWGRYPLEEWSPEAVLDPSVAPRLLRPNLRYRFYRICSPFSAHVTLVTLEGENREGFCFSVGAACRESRRASWMKSILEAVQGLHYVRLLKGAPVEVPTSFPEHAVYYSDHPERLKETVLHRAGAPSEEDGFEDTAALVRRLGRPVLFRNLTPPEIASQIGDWIVLRVLVSGLQPLHGDHRLAHLGGPLWRPRGVAEWAGAPPHPFP